MFSARFEDALEHATDEELFSFFSEVPSRIYRKPWQQVPDSPWWTTQWLWLSGGLGQQHGPDLVRLRRGFPGAGGGDVLPTERHFVETIGRRP